MRSLFLALLSILFFAPTMDAQSRRKRKNAPVPLELNDSLYSALKWRNIGPFRGGRSVASTGVVSQPGTYYMGSTGGGIWKTVNNGNSWKNISDGFLKTGTVGAIAVSESDPNTVLVGMGEHAARGVMTSMGDGVYLSRDAGQSWTHIGLEESRHISDVIIHPTNPDVFYVAVQGAQYGPSTERGVYRSINGGQSWEKVHYVNDRTGASSLVMDMTNPRVLYAAMWDHKRFPWQIESGGEGSGMYKSLDGGTSWKKLSKGLPEVFGKSGISVSRANNQRLFAVIEAEGEKGGVYRSDNAGKTWMQVNKNRVNIARSWYYMEIFADPQNENIVYVLNAPVLKSIDGGRSFTPLPTPHGDNHHLWIHPDNNQVMINSNDGGANVSLDGGKSWSTQQNQPTAQFYRVITDNRFPYYVYGGQQDNSAIAIASRTNDMGIDWKDWYSVAGCESAFLAFDPNNPEVVYGGCYQGIIDRWEMASGESKNIMVYPELRLSKQPSKMKYRFNWNAPIITSAFNREVMYHAGNVVLKTTDGGQRWMEVSPDLTRNEKDKHGPGGAPFTNEAAGGENYNTLMSLVESLHDPNTLWAGSDDGLLHVTRDGGQNWSNVSPPGAGRKIINSIEVSPHDPATVYVVAMGYKEMDLKSHIYKTTDYGASWSELTQGLNDPHGFARVVREDPVRQGLLYAGTETGLAISLNGGMNWQKFQRNLPIVPINDLTIRNNDLVAATAGRSFWILDDLSPLQSTSGSSVALLKPISTSLYTGGHTKEALPGLGQNPQSGVGINYYLPADMDSVEVSLEILEGQEVIRRYSNQKSKGFKSWPGGPSKPAVLASKKGMHRFYWDFRRESLPSIDKVFVFGGYQGSRVGPGVYGVRLSIGDQVFDTQAEVTAHPYFKQYAADYATQQDLLKRLDKTVLDLIEDINTLRSARTQVNAHAKHLKGKEEYKELLDAGKALSEAVAAWEEELIQPKQKTFQDVINFPNQLVSELLYLKEAVNSADPRVTQGAIQRGNDLFGMSASMQSKMNAIMQKELADYNRLYQSSGLMGIILAD
ncbi:WD40/YVTN/BNR-like repeat-containing protein [Aureicoccus marinus]|uniref:Glycosyl hydrolase n=1 Tax=Aureicoccus marinus TaxID=754435 RepID=A0A2S7T5T8_9FLAO|nr:glycosyl hydrolase [Aureicoccus marinus]PQJ15289.1 glycosyl hydrolase [Aureicoccus marinus]